MTAPLHVAAERWQLVEDALRAAARGLADRADSHPHWFAAAVVDRSRRYTSERQELHRPADREADLAARALFFSPADAAKLAVPLAELVQARGGLFGPAAAGAASGEADVVRVVDLGAGCGAMSLGLLASGAELATRWELTLVDRDAPALAIARGALEHLAAALGLAVQVKVIASDLSAWRPQPCDLVLAGTVLNELTPAAARNLVGHALSSIARPAGSSRGPGAVLLLDPALREPARRLHELRDEHLAAGTAHVVAPCVRRGAPCPMLAKPTDWCHEDRPFEAPRHLRAVADVTHLRDGSLKFAYLVLALQPSPLVAPPTGAVALRVVSNALPGKGRREFFVCGDAGKLPIRRLDRRATAQNEWFDELRRGDVVTVPAERLADEKGRVELFEDDGLPVLKL